MRSCCLLGQEAVEEGSLGGACVRGRWISEFFLSLVYRSGFRTARATERIPVSINEGKRKEREDKGRRKIEGEE